MAVSVYPPAPAVADAVRRALAEDLGPLGDLTSALLPPDAVAVASLVPRHDGVLAGRSAAIEVFAQVDVRVTVEWMADDGDAVYAGRPLAHVRGPLASVLTAERTALNFLCHLSGIATLTRRYVEAAAPAAVRDTRKTTPGLRALEKAAVRAGGGVNHRGSLSDGILVKDNHLGGLSVEQAVARARARWPGRSIQVECDTPDQFKAAVAAGVELVLLDNMSPAEVALCVSTVRDGLRGPNAAAGLRGPNAVTGLGGPNDVTARCLVEVSGGVTLGTVGAYAEAGADLISVGALTHSAPGLDIGLDLLSGTA